MSLSVSHITIKKVTADTVADVDDVLATEEPLEIRINYGTADARIQKNLSVTMRTPGADTELAVGFLFTEGIIKQYSDVKGAFTIPDNIVQVVLKEDVELDLAKLERHFYTTSSCGVCGKSSISAIQTVCNVDAGSDELLIPSSLIYKLPDMLRQQQAVFDSTGGLHASALFDAAGSLILLREDVGRHNALDKLIGAALQAGIVPMDNHVLLLSGRASFELIQKAAMAGIRMVAAVGAPSSLAAQTAAAFGMTLIGFLRGERFNIYTGNQRIAV